MYPHINCDLKPSRFLLGWCAILLGWVLCLMLWLTIPSHYFYVGIVFRIVVVVSVACFCIYVLRRDYFLNKPDSILSFHYHQDHWKLKLRSGEFINVLLRGDSVVWYELMALGFNFPNKKQRFVMIFPDSCDKNTQRQLRVQLRLLAKQQKHRSMWQQLKMLALGVKEE